MFWFLSVVAFCRWLAIDWLLVVVVGGKTKKSMGNGRYCPCLFHLTAAEREAYRIAEEGLILSTKRKMDAKAPNASFTILEKEFRLMFQEFATEERLDPAVEEEKWKRGMKTKSREEEFADQSRVYNENALLRKTPKQNGYWTLNLSNPQNLGKLTIFGQTVYLPPPPTLVSRRREIQITKRRQPTLCVCILGCYYFALHLIGIGTYCRFRIVDFYELKTANFKAGEICNALVLHGLTIAHSPLKCT